MTCSTTTTITLSSLLLTLPPKFSLSFPFHSLTLFLTSFSSILFYTTFRFLPFRDLPTPSFIFFTQLTTPPLCFSSYSFFNSLSIISATCCLFSTSAQHVVNFSFHSLCFSPLAALLLLRYCYCFLLLSYIINYFTAFSFCNVSTSHET